MRNFEKKPNLRNFVHTFADFSTVIDANEKLTQADAVRRLIVAFSVIEQLWDQIKSENSVSRRHIPGQPRDTPTGDSF
ncbi:hypothetical protein TNCV_3307011 [Trichonephila clavipes]|nr:hypothetical protein TNCV_3307011 [Trichonephila clavipes]